MWLPTLGVIRPSWLSHMDNEESLPCRLKQPPPLLSMHRPSGATITARGCSKQDLPLWFSSLQEQRDFQELMGICVHTGAQGSHCWQAKKIKHSSVESTGSRLAVDSLTSTVPWAIPYYQQLPLDNFHWNDSSLASVVFHNQMSEEAMKWKGLIAYLQRMLFFIRTMFTVCPSHFPKFDCRPLRLGLQSQHIYIAIVPSEMSHTYRVHCHMCLASVHCNCLWV